jgi:hypothetical protein
VTAGYSGTPLPRKLGIEAGDRVALVGAPPGFADLLGPLPAGVVVTRALRGPPLDVVVLFTTRRRDLVARLPSVRALMRPAAGFWVAWPKRTSGVATEVTEDVVREVALPTGLVDNKVCAIDATWSGLRLVIRKALR